MIKQICYYTIVIKNATDSLTKLAFTFKSLQLPSYGLNFFFFN